MHARKRYENIDNAKQHILIQNNFVQEDQCFSSVSVPLGCSNRTPQTGWLRNSTYLFLTVLEAGPNQAAGRVRSAEDLLLDAQTAVFWLCAHVAERTRELLQLIPFTRAPPSCPNHLLKPHLQVHHTRGTADIHPTTLIVTQITLWQQEQQGYFSSILQK